MKEEGIIFYAEDGGGVFFPSYVSLYEVNLGHIRLDYVRLILVTSR
jgi:hypothetical protein